MAYLHTLNLYSTTRSFHDAPVERREARLLIDEHDVAVAIAALRRVRREPRRELVAVRREPVLDTRRGRQAIITIGFAVVIVTIGFAVIIVIIRFRATS